MNNLSWETANSLLHIVWDGFQVVVWTLFLYYFAISVFGWFKRKEVPAENFQPVNKFAVIVAAHNEERVIADIIKSLKRLKYPTSMYDIFVIADNCEDDTALIARENGARVFERFDKVKKGKGHSLEWMFKKLFEMEKKFDAICILDADNLVSSNFLMEMNKQLCQGHKVIQGYLDSKNPNDSWVSGSYSISYWLSNRLFQLPRHYLGLNCALGGTGFVMSYDVLKEIGWGATCLTEDLEFSMRLVLKGLRVSWAHEAIIYDEKPLKLPQSWKQRKRWMQGHSDCAQRFFKDVMVKAFKDRSMVAFDAALYLIQPFMMVANGIILLAALVNLLRMNDYSRLLSFSNLSSLALAAVLTSINLVFIIAEGKFSKRIFKYFIVFHFYNLTWVPIIIQGFIDRHKKEWVHTLHTRSLDISDIESLEKVG